MLAIFDNQLSTIDSELLTLQARLLELKKVKKDLETKQGKASEALEALKTLTAELAGEAIDALKSAVMAIFPATEATAPTSMQSEFVVEVGKAEAPAAEKLPIIKAIAPLAPEQPYMEFVALSATVGYFKKTSDGEIQNIYLGCKSHKRANEWAKLITLWGGDVSAIRSDKKRLTGTDIGYEIKFKNLRGCGVLALLVRG
ncbi:hypothetical protein [Argonema antarcticum]|uniref:hypothetical protein n=1 Tax=Argonema antarcticum TaxID=2942763 RepID=UPI002011DC07|nr:hypothetical protein [Argonema antarcticum]MCL1475699.1 hypothetical protein [Argonema antarcticum A004/B2]